MSFRSDSIKNKPIIASNTHENAGFDLNEHSQFNFDHLNHEDINVSNPASVVINNESFHDNSNLTSDTERPSENQNENFSKRKNSAEYINNQTISDTYLQFNETKHENFPIGQSGQLLPNTLLHTSETKNESFPNEKNDSTQLNNFLTPSEQVKIEQKLKNEQFSSIIYESGKKAKENIELKK